MPGRSCPDLSLRQQHQIELALLEGAVPSILSSVLTSSDGGRGANAPEVGRVAGHLLVLDRLLGQGPEMSLPARLHSPKIFGAPEGDPLSVAAMAAACWHRFRTWRSSLLRTLIIGPGQAHPRQRLGPQALARCSFWLAFVCQPIGPSLTVGGPPVRCGGSGALGHAPQAPREQGLACRGYEISTGRSWRRPDCCSGRLNRSAEESLWARDSTVKYLHWVHCPYGNGGSCGVQSSNRAEVCAVIQACRHSRGLGPLILTSAQQLCHCRMGV